MVVMIHLTRFNLPPPKPGPDTHGGASPAKPIERTRTTWTQTWHNKEAFQIAGDYRHCLPDRDILYAQVCVTTDENGVETKTNLVKSSPSSTSSPSQTSSQFETRAKVNRIQDHLLFKIYVYILTITSTGSFGVYTVKVLGPLLRLCYSHYKVSFQFIKVSSLNS